MPLSKDESRALGFVALLLLLSAGARLLHRPPAVAPEIEALDLAAHQQASQERRDAEERRSKPLAPGEKLDPNTASAEELDRLPRVGAALAARIIAEREKGGPFSSVADLARVSGVGPAMAERLGAFLTLPDGPHAAGEREGGREGEGFSVPSPSPSPSPSPKFAASPRRSEGRGSGAGAASGEGEGRAVVDVNRASAEELERVPGIGPALARRIIAYRDSIGRFRTIEELDGIRGIGPATLERLRPYLRIAP